ncbi:hypothetical protein Tco_0866842 [Tanacetum coccineum]
MGIFRETLVEGTEGALGPERPRVYSDLSPEDKDRTYGTMLKDASGGSELQKNGPFNVDNVFQVDDCDAFDSDVDEAPMAQTMFMANLSSADPVYDEAGLSYDSDILSEVHDHDIISGCVCEIMKEHEMHGRCTTKLVVESHAIIEC